MTSDLCSVCHLTPTCHRAQAAILVVRDVGGPHERQTCNGCGGGDAGPNAVIEKGKKK